MDYVHGLYLEKCRHGTPLAQHFMKHVAIAKLVDETIMNEETVIKAITNHHTKEIQNHLIFSGVKTIDGVLEILTEYDKVSKHGQNQYQTNPFKGCNISETRNQHRVWGRRNYNERNVNRNDNSFSGERRDDINAGNANIAN